LREADYRKHRVLAVEIGAPLLVFGARRAPGTDLDVAAESASAAPLGTDVDELSPHILYLTSGSTGRPKGALVSQRASWLRASGGGGTFSGDLRGTDGVVTAFPLYHYGGWSYVMEAWHNRRPAHLVGRAVADQILEAAARWRGATRRSARSPRAAALGSPRATATRRPARSRWRSPSVPAKPGPKANDRC
jgi:fatty-acyl-CoA synthase